MAGENVPGWIEGPIKWLETYAFLMVTDQMDNEEYNIARRMQMLVLGSEV